MFFGWYVVAGTFVSQLLVVGFFTYAISLLVAPVRAEFGASLEQVMYGPMVGTLAGIIVTPLAGAMLDRYPVRWLMSAGVAIFAAGLWLLARCTSIAQFIVLFGITMSLAHGFAGSMPASTTIARWFSSNRGKALGIAAIGTSVGGMLIPALLTYWLGQVGWRGALDNMALLALLLVLPLIIITVRGKPADVGLLAEGETTATPPGEHLGGKDILRNPGYWLIGLPLGSLFCVYAAVLANLSPYALDLGHTAAQASRLIMLVAIAGFAGKLLFGVIADKVSLKLALWAAMALVIAALLLMAAQPGYGLIMLAACLLGLAAGGMLPVWGAMMARVFGLVSYGKAMGLMGPLLTLSVLPGFAILGRLYDASGNYQMGLLVFAAIVTLGAVLLAPLRLTRTPV